MIAILTKKSMWRLNKMLVDNEKKRIGYIKAKTPEARKKQKAAIVAYYAKKREESKKK